jgi:hypothetical protein
MKTLINNFPFDFGFVSTVYDNPIRIRYERGYVSCTSMHQPLLDLFFQVSVADGDYEKKFLYERISDSLYGVFK